jgi:hypothetical protein
MDSPFLDAVRSVDPAAISIAQEPAAEWLRTSTGIVGRVSLEDCADALSLKHSAPERIAGAYSLLDRSQGVEYDECWNVLLLVAVGGTSVRDASDSDALTFLASVARDTSGSRKVILWSDDSPIKHVGPFGSTGSEPTLIVDPIRDALLAMVATEGERDLVELLFKRRLTESDVSAALVALVGAERP